MSEPEVDTATRRRRPSLDARRRAARRKRLAIALAAAVAAGGALLLAGYWSSRTYAPQGQVAAVVDHEEITLQDLQAEARARGVPFSDARAPDLLAPVIDRTLLAHAAKAQGLDRLPTFPVDRRRIEQLLLAKQLSDQILADPSPAPNDAEIAAFQQAHPYRFAQRQRLQLRQIRFEAGDDVMRQLGVTPTADALVGALRRLAVGYQDETVTADTADLDPRLAQTLTASPTPALLLTRRGAGVVADSVLSREPEPLTGAVAAEDARRLILQARDHARLDTAIAGLRRKARIVYQDGLAPH